MGALTTGDGREGADMGPLVTGAHRDKVASYLDTGVREGARLVVDGRDVEPRAPPRASGSARRSSTTYDPGCRSTTTRSSARC